MEDYGRVYLNLDEMIVKNGISKNQLSYKSKMSHTQINRFCSGDASRIDLNTIARLCYALECKVSELVIYEPPKKCDTTGNNGDSPCQ